MERGGREKEDEGVRRKDQVHSSIQPSCYLHKATTREKLQLDSTSTHANR